MAPNARDRIIRALRDNLARDGNASVTLEAVAAEAGVSKGGLLYHFPSKAALYRGLLTSVRDSVTAEMAAAVERSGAARGFLEYSEPTADDEVGFFTSLIAVVRSGGSPDVTGSAEIGTAHTDGETDPDDAGRTVDSAALLADIFRAWEEPMRAAVPDPVQAENIRLVGFGLYFAALAGLPPVEAPVLAELFERLLAPHPVRAATRSNDSATAPAG